ncbi:MAG: nucleotide sugar dehydrogenase [Anaerolineae bacterium]|nr:nucleotide sugar dehydrogenase [Anaerolineae bacterium]MBN8621370.1 nucleotide sugar dehydrogenase [Anaerolineae bacterium]
MLLHIDASVTKLGVVGLGYVGLPLAALFAHKGFETIGLDIDAARIGVLQRGESPFHYDEPGLPELLQSVMPSGRLSFTTDATALNQADIILICVQTPVDDSDNLPRYDHLRSALRSVGQVLKAGALVIIESTIAPGTMSRVVIPELEAATGGRVGQAFYAGHCPERVMPGRLLHNLRNMSRVAGGMTPQVAAAMHSLYSHIVEATIDTTDMLTAELVKTTENAYRDVQIAFANEVARICEAVGGDVWKVRELVNKSPGRNMLYPGAGVGGHCIPKDSWLLIANADEAAPALIPTARHVNRSMPLHVADLTTQALEHQGHPVAGAVVAVLGYAYLENSSDTRDTPSQAFIEVMRQRGAVLRIHDPFVEGYQQPLAHVLQGAHAAVIMVAHNEYKQFDWAALAADLSVIVDGRHILPPDFTSPAATVRVIGRGDLS